MPDPTLFVPVGTEAGLVQDLVLELEGRIDALPWLQLTPGATRVSVVDTRLTGPPLIKLTGFGVFSAPLRTPRVHALLAGMCAAIVWRHVYPGLELDGGPIIAVEEVRVYTQADIPREGPEDLKKPGFASWLHPLADPHGFQARLEELFVQLEWLRGETTTPGTFQEPAQRLNEDIDEMARELMAFIERAAH